MATSIPENLQVLVTGGSGFLGTGIVSALLDKYPKWRISILDQRPPDPQVASRLDQILSADIRIAESVHKAFLGYSPDLVVHTAGVIPAGTKRYSTKDEDWQRVRAVNYDGTRHILDETLASACKLFVYTSSCTVVTDDMEHDYFYMDEKIPTGLATLHYGKSKGMAERYVLSPEHAEKGLVACALRPCTILGPTDTAVISRFHESWRTCSQSKTYSLRKRRPDMPSSSATSNQEPVYFWDFLIYVWAQFDHVPKYRMHISETVAWGVASVLEWKTWLTGMASALDRGSVRDGARSLFANNDKAKRILGYEPIVGLSEGVKLTCMVYADIQT
ncbi:hypothetical protein LTR82_008279 [Friedmanniomyces endolithicus]|uniref:3-beta hydroxysteroid dehydrogenase/isomerase domain-containing protein n=1 Tax=Friedmanniomyces endolithicus TaxID=329885 RepID=A0AAN6FQU7_9PEZI|nr:hypothetical protein LTR82_008279 [Friedmanniomyces endolithicus]